MCSYNSGENLKRTWETLEMCSHRKKVENGRSFTFQNWMQMHGIFRYVSGNCRRESPKSAAS